MQHKPFKLIAIVVSFTLLVGLIWFIWAEVTWKPMTYKDAKNAAPLNVQHYCKHRKLTPCDFTLVKEEDTGGVWDFYYRSKTHKTGLRIVVYSDGEIDVDTPISKEVNNMLDLK